MSINKNELTKEQIQKAMACKTVEELMELAKRCMLYGCLQ